MKNHSIQLLRINSKYQKYKHTTVSPLYNKKPNSFKMKYIILVTLFASTYAGILQQQKIAFAAQPAGLTYTSSVVAAQPAAIAVQPAPQHYSHAIPAAAIRNVETVGVTKTITPVVTKTTTTQTHSEPAVSVGQVQGYTQSAHGPAQIAPVQYNTQYTSYQNPTVGVNGPVTYAGPALQQGVAVQAAPVAYAQPAYAQPAYAQPAYTVAHAAPAAYAVSQPGYSVATAHSHGAPSAAVATYGQPAGLYSVQPALAAVQPQFAYASHVAAVPQYAAVAEAHQHGTYAKY